MRILDKQYYGAEITISLGTLQTIFG
jgi:hypothetical protein